jgi:hypothetical protein
LSPYGQTPKDVTYNPQIPIEAFDFIVTDEIDQLITLASSTLGRFHLDGKAAVVVGGGRGLGQAVTLALAAVRASICGAGRTP